MDIAKLYSIQTKVTEAGPEPNGVPFDHACIELSPPSCEGEDVDLLDAVASYRWAQSVLARLAVTIIPRLSEDQYSHGCLSHNYENGCGCYLSWQVGEGVVCDWEIGPTLTIQVPDSHLARWEKTVKETLASLMQNDLKQPTPEELAAWDNGTR